VSNGQTIDDHWVIAEVAMFTDKDCTELVNASSIVLSSMAYGDACVSDTSCPILMDGVCDTSPGCCDTGGTQWAGNDDAAAKAPGGTFVTYLFDSPVSVQCVQICHSEAAHQQMNNVVLEYSGDDGATFTAFDILDFPTAEGTVGGEVGSCSTSNPCPFGGFCNFDGGDTGRCEACGDCGGPDPGQCNDCGLPQAGADDCVSACTPPPPPTRHIGAACSADSPCPGAFFCNFDGGETGFCELCTDCGVSTDDWAGCTDCGLPDAGAADCTAACNANPDLLTADMWRITNGLPIGDHWVMSEMTMFSDRDCSIPLDVSTISVSSMSYGDACESYMTAPDSSEGINCTLFTDGVIDNSGGCCNVGGAKWAGNDDAAAKAPGGTWVSYSFDSPAAVQCVQISHSEEGHQQMLNVLLQYTSGCDTVAANCTWTTFDVLEFSAGAGQEVGACSIYNPCPTGAFCNFDGGNTGRCEACGDCGAPDGCDTCGLPSAGAADCTDACSSSPQGQHGLHTGSYCDADSTCPPGMFCNFDGDVQGVDGFCEMCLDCGSPDDSWAGCTDCGLPDAGGADCTTQCNANPDVLASAEWRITNGAIIGDHWIVSEVSMFSDRDCAVPLTPVSVAVSSMDYGVACGDPDNALAADNTVECPLFTDGTCDTSPHCCNEGGSQWAGGDGADDQAPGGTWISYRFAEPTTVGCIQVCHSEAEHQQMLNVMLQYPVLGDADVITSWETFDILQFQNDAGPSQDTGGCSVESPCPEGSFCNFDDGDAGRCEQCTDCEGPSGCYDCGLPTAGGDDCTAKCSAGGVGGEYCSTYGALCASGYFCNLDGGVAGRCEACGDCDGYTGGCGDCGLPDVGAADCTAMCIVQPSPAEAAAIVGAVEVTVTLDLDIADVGDAGTPERVAFESSFKTSLAATIDGVLPSQIIVTGVTGGSVVVDFVIIPGADGTAVSADVVTAVEAATAELSAAVAPPPPPEAAAEPPSEPAAEPPAEPVTPADVTPAAVAPPPSDSGAPTVAVALTFMVATAAAALSL
jgi:hypothetical protein